MGGEKPEPHSQSSATVGLFHPPKAVSVALFVFQYLGAFLHVQVDYTKVERSTLKVRRSTFYVQPSTLKYCGAGIPDDPDRRPPGVTCLFLFILHDIAFLLPTWLEQSVCDWKSSHDGIMFVVSMVQQWSPNLTHGHGKWVRVRLARSHRRMLQWFSKTVGYSGYSKLVQEVQG